MTDLYLAPPQAAGLAHSAVFPLPGEAASLGVAGGNVIKLTKISKKVKKALDKRQKCAAKL